MKHFSLCKSLLCLVAAGAVSVPVYAEWGTQTKAAVIYEHEGEILQFKTARTSDGYTYMSWLEWNLNWQPASSLMLCMQLLDPDGNPLWGDEGLVIDDYPSKSYTTQNSLLVDSQGNAYVSWADSRSQIDKVLTDDDQRYDFFEPVIYKVDKEGNMLWGEDGKTYDSSTYSLCPILYQAGGNIYAMMYGIGAGAYIPSYFTRIDAETGDLMGNMKSMGGQFIASVGTDIINVWASGSQTVAMRYNEDLEAVWSSPVTVAPYVYEGHSNFPFNLVSDYQGGVIVSFDRNIGSSKWMPIVNYITADGESTFGNAVDVTTLQNYNNTYNFIVYNPQTECILNMWGVSNPHLGLDGQLMDVFGERLWGGPGLEFTTKVTGNDYTFAPISATFTKDNCYWVLYVDETNWMQDTMFLICIDEDGKVVAGLNEDGTNSMRVGPYYQGIVSPSVYWDNGNMYLIYYNYVSDIYRVRTQMIPDLYEPGEVPEAPIPDTPGKISSIGFDESSATYYSIDGIRLNAPQKGLNIERDALGNTRKLIIK